MKTTTDTIVEGAPGAVHTPLANTGERMVPERSYAGTFWEHIYRYRFATRFVRGRRVLDIACGEGYGAAALSRAGAAHVVGVDIDPTVCQHAREKYALEVYQADATGVPLSSASIDVIVSFETIEHLPNPYSFLRESVRLLTRDGLLIVSTPNRELYTEASGQTNPFHTSEMSRTEFVSLLRRAFGSVQIYLQDVRSAPLWSPASLAASRSPWRSYRLYRAVRQRAVPKELRNSRPMVQEHLRRDPTSAIITQDGWLTRLFNPLEVHRSRHSTIESAMYFVAVCRHPRQLNQSD